MQRGRPRNRPSSPGVEDALERSSRLSILLALACACQVAAAPVAADTNQTAAQLVLRARANRYQQDSSLAEYRALARQRWTAQIGIAAAAGLGPLGRMRLAARFETVARIGWHHRLGAWADLIASRGVAPIAGEMELDAVTDEVAFALPFHPGRDRLWPMDELIGTLPEQMDVWIAHPLDAGADSLYRYALGGRQILTLPDGRRIQVRELLTRPVRPDHRLIVGSLWIDLADGALVHAAYRPSVPVDLWPYIERNFDEGDRSVMRKLGPFRGNVEEIVVEHGLYAGRFWLPRARIAHGEGSAKGGRLTISIEQTFSYERVSALAAGERQAPQPERLPGGLRDDSRRDRGLYYYSTTGQRTAMVGCERAGDSTYLDLPADSIPALGGRHRRTQEGIPIRVLLPCDPAQLIHSKALPGSIYAPGEALFTDRDLGRLQREARAALELSDQADWSPRATTWRYGLEDGLLRFNRIEALSVGVRGERELGRGYVFDVSARIGVADLEPNGEVGLQRRSGRAVLRASAYRRLDAVNDWGAPLGFSASLNTLLFGRDDWMYARALGAELRGSHARVSSSAVINWRLFAEHQGTADVGTTFSLARAAIGSDFAPNIVAQEGVYMGAAASAARTWGSNPLGAQFSARLAVEGAGGETDFGRASTELRLANGLGEGALGALTVAAGSSVGTLPTQRQWYLGGAQTVHAHRVGALAGDAFFLGRAEIAKGLSLIRPLLFADWGWAGDRDQLSDLHPRDHLWAAGLGAAFLDGLVRVDVSRALGARKGWSLDLFVEVR